MCFHTIQSKLANQIERRFNAKIRDTNLFEPHEHINGFTYPKIPIITNLKREIIDQYNWGLIPSWTKNDEIKAMTLNARNETIKGKRTLSHVITQRCSIVADDFYEWR